MKKSLLSLVGIAAIGVFLWGAANAQLFISDYFDWSKPKALDSYTKLLSDYDTKWWYLNNDAVSCDNTTSSVNIKSKIIYDSDVMEAPAYRLFLSPYRIDQLKAGNSDIDTSKIIMKELKRDSNSNEVAFTLWDTDWIDKDQAYYWFIVPINDYDEVGTPTKEICFQISSNTCVRDEACNTLELLTKPTATSDDQSHRSASDDSHGANCAWMDLANVSHTVKDGVITLTWTAVPDGDIVEIAIFDPALEEYKSLWAVNMKDEKFSYTMQWDWEQNFSLTNGCKEVRYKADASMKTPEKTPNIVTPATWPAENVLIIAIAAIILYGAYTVFFRKSENK